MPNNITIMSMYDLLNTIINQLEVTITNYDEVYFSMKDLSEHVAIGDDALSKSLQRLVKRGMVVRINYRKPDTPGRFCKYRVSNPGVIRFATTYYDIEQGVVKE